MSNELKPCAHCGGEAIKVTSDIKHDEDTRYWVTCNSLMCGIRTDWEHNDWSLAIESWNTRADSTQLKHPATDNSTQYNFSEDVMEICKELKPIYGDFKPHEFMSTLVQKILQESQLYKQRQAMQERIGRLEGALREYVESEHIRINHCTNDMPGYQLEVYTSTWARAKEALEGK